MKCLPHLGKFFPHIPENARITHYYSKVCFYLWVPQNQGTLIKLIRLIFIDMKNFISQNRKNQYNQYSIVKFVVHPGTFPLYCISVFFVCAKLSPIMENYKTGLVGGIP